MSPANYLDRHMSGGGRGGVSRLLPAPRTRLGYLRPRHFRLVLMPVWRSKPLLDGWWKGRLPSSILPNNRRKLLEPSDPLSSPTSGVEDRRRSGVRPRLQQWSRRLPSLTPPTNQMRYSAQLFSPSVAEPPNLSSKVPAQQQLKPIGDEEPVRQTHRQKRWKMFQEMRQQFGPSKQDKVRYNRVVEAMKNATTVPIEIVDLRPSLKLRHEPRIYQHGELARLGITTIQWDGMYSPFPLLVSFNLPGSRDSVPVKTPSGIVIAVLAGRPRSSGWDERMKSLTSGIEAAGNLMTFQTGGNWHHRGAYPGINTGISYGGGSQVRASLPTSDITWADFPPVPR